MPRNPIERLDRLEELVEDLLQRLERAADEFLHTRESLNEAYAQGVRDATERRTHVDPVHGPHDA